LEKLKTNMIEVVLLKSFLLLISFLGMVFFSLSETALTSLTKDRIKKIILTEEGKNLKMWLHSPQEILTSILVGNNISVIFATVIVISISLDLSRISNLDFKKISFILTALFIFFTLLFGEIIPKSYAKYNPEKLSLFSIPILKIFVGIFSPLSKFVFFVSRLCLSLFNADISSKDFRFTKRYIEEVMEGGFEDGVIKPLEKEMVSKLLDLPDKEIRHIMIPEPEIDAIGLNWDKKEVESLIMEKKHSRFPIYKNNLDEIIGLIYTKDLIVMYGNPRVFVLEDFLREVEFVPETMKVLDLLKQFRKGKEHMAVVVDEYGTVTGLITLEDILEEVTGEIWDEFDEPEKEGIIRLSNNVFIIDALSQIDDVSEVLGLDIPYEDFSTIGGFVIGLFGYLPEKGEEIMYKNLKIKVLEGDSRRIKKLRIERTNG